MDNLSDSTKNNVLPEFQAFLLEKKLAPQKNVFFYALWASKFLNYSNKKQIPPDQYKENAVIEFIETLKSNPAMSDWQIRQAGDAIRLYYFHYRGLKPDNLSTMKVHDAMPELLEETQRLIRLKHYSYSTEKTYLQWIKRFLEYLSQTSKEVKRLLACLNGRDLLIAGLLYGSGLRLMELARLRVKDVDMDLNTLTVRGGKGDKDRTTILPKTVKDQLKNHLTEVKKLHENDLARGYGEVHLPDALGRKYPKAGKEWGWQY
ncbi:MAG: phage integrase N-terminal SAM-like domain-containing protein [Smithella sp.]